MRNFKTFFAYWLPVLLWIMMIFLASGDSHSSAHSSSFLEPLLRWLFPHLSQARLHIVNHLFRKCSHLGEYAVLAILVLHAIRHTRQKRSQSSTETAGLPTGHRAWKWEEAGLSLFIVFLFAATDEIHQIFVPTRTPLLSDVFLDTCGGAAALFVLWIFRRRMSNSRKR